MIDYGYPLGVGSAGSFLRFFCTNLIKQRMYTLFCNEKIIKI